MWPRRRAQWWVDIGDDAHLLFRLLMVVAFEPPVGGGQPSLLWDLGSVSGRLS